MRARSAARDVCHDQVGRRRGFIRHVHAEGAKCRGRCEVAGRVADLPGQKRDGVRAVVGEVPRAAGCRDAVGGRPRRAVGIHIDADERRVLAVSVRPGDANVAAVEVGHVDGHVVRIGDGERVRALARAGHVGGGERRSRRCAISRKGARIEERRAVDAPALPARHLRETIPVNAPVPSVVGGVLVCLGVVSNAGDEVIGPAVGVRIDDQPDGCAAVNRCRIGVPVEAAPHAVRRVGVGVPSGSSVVLEGVVDVAEPTPAVVVAARAETGLHIVGEGIVRVRASSLRLVCLKSSAARVDRLRVVRVVFRAGDHVVDGGGLSYGASDDEVVVALAVPVAEYHSGGRRPTAAVPDVRGRIAEEHTARAAAGVALLRRVFGCERGVDGKRAAAWLGGEHTDQIGLRQAAAANCGNLPEVRVGEQNSGFESFETWWAVGGGAALFAGAINGPFRAPHSVVSHVVISLV